MEPTAEFAQLLAAPQPPLDRLAFLIAAHAHPALDVGAYCDRLDDLAVDFGGGSAEALIAWMQARGFRGNEDDYYDPENSYLDSVLDRGLGIPITLSVVAIEVGRRAGVHLVGVGLPGEFVVAERDRPDRFHNPYRHRSMSSDDVDELVQRFVSPASAVPPEVRRPVGTLAIVSRMLANLTNAFGDANRTDDLHWVLGLRLLLPDATPEIRRQRLVLRSAMN